MEDIRNEVVPKIGVYFEEYKDIYTTSSIIHHFPTSFRRPEAEAQSIELLLHFSLQECGNSIDFLALLMDGVKWQICFVVLTGQAIRTSQEYKTEPRSNNITEHSIFVSLLMERGSSVFAVIKRIEDINGFTYHHQLPSVSLNLCLLCFAKEHNLKK